MSEKDNSLPLFLFSPFEIERQARIKRSLVIQSCVRGTMRAFTEWFRTFLLRSTQLARGLAAQRRIYSDIRELQQFDDRMLADIGVTTDRGAQFDGQIAAAQILSRAGLLAIIAFRLCGTASICLATGGIGGRRRDRCVPDLCGSRPQSCHPDRSARRGEDVAPEILAQAFFTVVEARKTCNQGQVESAIKLYESIPLDAGITHSQ